jgi:hypothetical protein
MPSDYCLDKSYKFSRLAPLALGNIHVIHPDLEKFRNLFSQKLENQKNEN